MSDRFDPYYKWLGIPPRDQPPNHYRLLAIELFESDPEVIDGAAKRLAGYVKSQGRGPHLEQARQLLAQLSAARRCLLDPQARAAYDQRLKAPPSTADAAPPVAVRSDSAPGLRVAKATSLTPQPGQLKRAVPVPPAPPQDVARSPEIGSGDLNIDPAAATFSPSSSRKHGNGHASRSRRNAPPGKKSPSWVMPVAVVGAMIVLLAIGVIWMKRGKTSAPLASGEAAGDENSDEPKSARPSPAAEPPGSSAESAKADSASSPTGDEDSQGRHLDDLPESLLTLIEEGGDVGQLAQMIEGGAKLDIKDSHGRTPLRLAVIHRRADLVKRLLAAKADAGLADARGETPLMSAAQVGDLALVKMLLAAGADPNAQTSVSPKGLGGLTALVVAARHGRATVVEALLAAGARVELAGKRGVTPLMVAAWQGQTAIVKTLLAKKARVSAVDAEGQTPLMYAAQGGNVEIVLLLLELGAHANERSTRGTSPLAVALERQEPLVVEKLRQAVKESAPVLDF